MSYMTSSSSQSGRNIGIRLDIIGLDDVTKALGNLASKSPAAAKVAINATARQARKLMIAKAKARYAANTAGAKHLNDLKQRRKASNSSLNANLQIEKAHSDLGYYKNVPRTVRTGTAALSGPEYVQAKVLKSSSLKQMKAGDGKSKSFLLQFKSGHIGMVQRVIGSHSNSTTTARGRPRWTNAYGEVEKLQTVNSPSATAMHHTIWADVQDEVMNYYMQRINEQVEKVIAREVQKAGG